MTLIVNGRKWEALDLETLKSSTAEVLVGCERCGSTCTSYGEGSGACRCCTAYGQRTRGGTPGRYPEDGKHHISLMTMTRFRARMKEVAA